MVSYSPKSLVRYTEIACGIPIKKHVEKTGHDVDWQDTMGIVKMAMQYLHLQVATQTWKAGDTSSGFQWRIGSAVWKARTFYFFSEAKEGITNEVLSYLIRLFGVW